MQITTALIAEIIAPPPALDPAKYKERTRPGILALLMTFGRALDDRHRYRRIVDELLGMSECKLAELGLGRCQIAAAAAHLTMKTEHEHLSECRTALQKWSEAQDQ